MKSSSHNNFQFHQGLSYLLLFQWKRFFRQSFNSIKDYRIRFVAPIERLPTLHFQFHQGLSCFPPPFFIPIIFFFQFHQGLSGSRYEDYFMVELRALSIPSRIILMFVWKYFNLSWNTFNSIKDYQNRNVGKVTFTCKDFQFHQGLSIHKDLYFSLWFYFFQFHQGLSLSNLFHNKFFLIFQFHQGLSEYFYTLTILLFFPPLI